MPIIKKQNKFESNQKIILFTATILATILITRIIIYCLIDINFKIFNFEFHHFDYGLILLIIIVLFMLFTEKSKKIYIILSAISLGLIIDELFFIRKQITGNNPAIYNPSLAYVLLIAIIISLLAFLISKFSKK